jgi:hypothetical protein
MKATAIAALLFLLALVVHHGPTYAQEVTRTASSSITLGTGVCSAQMLVNVPPQFHARMRSGSGVWWDRKTYDICWLREGARIVVLWEDGSLEAFPANAFEAGA